MSKIVLADSCYWLGLVDPKDQHYETSMAIAKLINDYTVIVPWPCMFESVSTHLTRNRYRTLLFEETIKKRGVELFPDDKYREVALSQVFDYSRNFGFSFSLVDSILREILKDVNVKVDYLITYNERDFSDVCANRQIEIINK